MHQKRAAGTGADHDGHLVLGGGDVGTAQQGQQIGVEIQGELLGFVGGVEAHQNLLPLVLAARIFLGAVFSGNFSTILYSAGGGFLAWCVLCLMSKVLTKDQIWLASPVSGVFHNIGQLAVAAAVMETTVVFAYLPWLLIAGVCAGLFTGLCAQFLSDRLEKINQ